MMMKGVLCAPFVLALLGTGPSQVEARRWRRQDLGISEADAAALVLACPTAIPVFTEFGQGAPEFNAETLNRICAATSASACSGVRNLLTTLLAQQPGVPPGTTFDALCRGEVPIPDGTAGASDPACVAADPSVRHSCAAPPTTCAEFTSMAAAGGCASACDDAFKKHFHDTVCEGTPASDAHEDDSTAGHEDDDALETCLTDQKCPTDLTTSCSQFDSLTASPNWGSDATYVVNALNDPANLCLRQIVDCACKKCGAALAGEGWPVKGQACAAANGVVAPSEAKVAWGGTVKFGYSDGSCSTVNPPGGFTRGSPGGEKAGSKCHIDRTRDIDTCAEWAGMACSTTWESQCAGTSHFAGPGVTLGEFCPHICTGDHVARQAVYKSAGRNCDAITITESPEARRRWRRQDLGISEEEAAALVLACPTSIAVFTGFAQGEAEFNAETLNAICAATSASGCSGVRNLLTTLLAQQPGVPRGTTFDALCRGEVPIPDGTPGGPAPPAPVAQTYYFFIGRLGLRSGGYCHSESSSQCEAALAAMNNNPFFDPATIEGMSCESGHNEECTQDEGGGHFKITFQLDEAVKQKVLALDATEVLRLATGNSGAVELTTQAAKTEIEKIVTGTQDSPSAAPEVLDDSVVKAADKNNDGKLDLAELKALIAELQTGDVLGSASASTGTSSNAAPPPPPPGSSSSAATVAPSLAAAAAAAAALLW